MFNSYSSNNNFSYNINAVSGTLRKSHPKSKFCVREVDSSSYIFNDEKPRLVYGSHEEIVVLQAMLTGENKVLVEYVLKKDFEQRSNDENE
jgi:hypothetical protein